ncbi:MAG: hypothetical protein AAB874_03110 [Patescibacteria group bacterium]
MNEIQNIDTIPNNDTEKIDFTDLARSWLEKETRKQADRTRTHPPLLPNDQLSINGKSWIVSLVNTEMLYTEWPNNEPPIVPNLSGSGIHKKPSRVIAVVHPEEDKKQTHYLLFGRKAIGNEQYESSFQLIPVTNQARTEIVSQTEDDLITKIFIRGEAPTKLEDDTSWFSQIPIQPVTDIKVTHKNQIPEPEITAFTKLRVAVKERERMYKAFREAWKFFPGAALLGSTIAVTSLNTSNVMGMIAGSTVGLSTIFFQKTLEMLNRDLNKVITEQLNLPQIKNLARLEFASPKPQS